MGTRAVITFNDELGSHSVYQHWDGDPETVANNVAESLRFAWPLPRFEADEFAAAYIAANKKGPGNIRATQGPKAHGDLSYVYEVTCVNGSLSIKTSKP